MRPAILLASLLLAPPGCSEQPFQLTVTFVETGGLKPGDNVTMRGLSIGQVRAIDIESAGVAVRVEIEPPFRKHMREGVAFQIASEKLVTGKRMLVVRPAVQPGSLLKARSRLTGQPVDVDPLEKVGRTINESVDHARAQATGLVGAMLAPDQQPPRATGGTVDLDQPGQVVLRLISARVHPTTADGDDWDVTGEPDLLAQVWVDQHQVLLTEVAEDTLTARWGVETERFDVGGKRTVRVKVLDQDASFNDEIGIVEFVPTLADAKIDRVFRLAGGRIAEIKLQLSVAKPQPIRPAPD